MQLLREAIGARPFPDKFLHFFHLISRPGFKALGVVEDKLRIALEYQLVLDVVDSALG